MLEGFLDRDDERLHCKFQEWRQENLGGFFLTFKSGTRAILHKTICRHPGTNLKWGCDGLPFGGSSLTTHRKVCAANQAELLSWADQNNVHYKPCKDCITGSLTNRRVKATVYCKENREEISLSQEPPNIGQYREGARKTIAVNVYERNAKARRACITHYGTSCMVCGFDFEVKYGEVGEAFIHVHHIVPLSKSKKAHRVDPVKDLRPVCPNCHEMIHRTLPMLSIEDLKARLR